MAARRLVLNRSRSPNYSDAVYQIWPTMADGRRFSTPKRRLTIEKGSFQDKKERYKGQIEDHVFNHSVSFSVTVTRKPASYGPCLPARRPSFVHVMQAGLWYACNIYHLSCVDLELKKVSHMSSYYAGAV